MIENMSNEKLWNKIYAGFENDICNKCSSNISSYRFISDPEPIPYVGTDYEIDTKYKLMFVGIESYSNTPRLDSQKIKYNPFCTEQIKALYFKDSKKSGIINSPFWNWVNDISTKVHGIKPEEAFKKIAYSNLNKCQSRATEEGFSKPQYQLVEKLSTNCIKESKWIFKEISEVNPKNVIVFTGIRRGYLLAKLFIGDKNTIKYFNCNLYDEDHKWRCGKDLFIHLRDGDRRFIITNHPQGTPNEVKDEIIRIIKDDYWESAEKWNT